MTRAENFDQAQKDYESALSRYREAERAFRRAVADLNSAERLRQDAWRALTAEREANYVAALRRSPAGQN